MTKITRKTQKIFANAATNNGVIGSGQDGTKVLSSDLPTLMAKGAWDTGWLDMVLGTKKFPPLEEFQALDFINTRQAAYMFQEGMPEYDAGTTYYTNCWVKKAGTNQIWVSLTNTNVGNALTDAANWALLVDFSAAPPAYSGFVTGDGKEHWGADLATGFIWADGLTIGDASSNATNRANADTLNLFTMFWTDFTDATLPIYTSAGVLSSRSGSAASDFAAHKRMSVIDKRGRVSAGKDDMGGTAANRLTAATIDGTILGNYGGTETVALTGAQNGAHTHAFSGTTGSAGAHQHLQYNSDFLVGTETTTLTGGNYPVVKLGVPSDYYSYVIGGSANTPSLGLTSSAGDHSHSVSGTTGSGGTGDAHNNVQSTIVCNYVIKL
jgi:microcystin-dependent protein